MSTLNKVAKICTFESTKSYCHYVYLINEGQIAHPLLTTVHESITTHHVKYGREDRSKTILNHTVSPFSDDLKPYPPHQKQGGNLHLEDKHVELSLHPSIPGHWIHATQTVCSFILICTWAKCTYVYNRNIARNEKKTIHQNRVYYQKKKNEKESNITTCPFPAYPGPGSSLVGSRAKPFRHRARSPTLDSEI